MNFVIEAASLNTLMWTQEVFITMIIEQQNNGNYGHADFMQCIGCITVIWLQEFSTAIGFVVLCMKVLVCSSWGCV
jgi:hypothetical protein